MKGERKTEKERENLGGKKRSRQTEREREVEREQEARDKGSSREIIPHCHKISISSSPLTASYSQILF